ncbi:MAG: ankyrin repeat domain-containing protein [Candidatus Dependentiae bacterium]|nr:ankyrin repeat domain-containing protein [Candidatus Dependentiae bacterium]
MKRTYTIVIALFLSVGCGGFVSNSFAAAELGALNDAEYEALNKRLVAAVKNNNTAQAAAALSAGADVNCRNINSIGNWTMHSFGQPCPVIYAASKGYTDMVKVLCSRPDIDVNVAKKMCSALWHAVSKEYSEIVYILMLAGADDRYLDWHNLNEAIMRPVVEQAKQEMRFAPGLSVMLTQTDVLRQFLKEAGMVGIVDEYAALPFVSKKAKAQ